MASAVAVFAVCLGLLALASRLLNYLIDRAKEGDYTQAAVPDPIEKVRRLPIWDAKVSAEVLLEMPDKFTVELARDQAELTGLPDAVRALFSKYSRIAFVDGYVWLSHSSLEWAPWDNSLRVIGGDRDGMRVVVRSDCETVYQMEREFDEPERIVADVEFPSVYHWLVYHGTALDG